MSEKDNCCDIDGKTGWQDDAATSRRYKKVHCNHIDHCHVSRRRVQVATIVAQTQSHVV